MLDFLGEPSESLLKGSKKKGELNHGGKKATNRTAKQQQQDDDDEPLQRGQMPTDQQLESWARYFIKVFNMEKATIKVAMEVAEDKFGVDLKKKKNLLKEYLAQAQS